jgi:hypothetical protein
MRSRLCAAILLLGFAVMLTAGAIASASAAEPEAPYLKVNSKRLFSKESQAVQIKNAAETKEGGTKEVILKGNYAAGPKTVNETRCKTVTSTKSILQGSEAFHDATTEFNIALSGCSLWVNLGEGFVLEKACAVEVVPAQTAAGRFWYEGVSKLQGTKIALSLEAAELATVTLKGASCKLASKYVLGGSVAAAVSPQDQEAKAMKLTFPATPIEIVWQPQLPSQKELELKLNGNRVVLQGEFELVLEKGLVFGAFNTP